ncbi:MAG: hypothetical protein ACHQ50_00880 [Fimbriimonadales bacterium]
MMTAAILALAVQPQLVDLGVPGAFLETFEQLRRVTARINNAGTIMVSFWDNQGAVTFQWKRGALKTIKNFTVRDLNDHDVAVGGEWSGSSTIPAILEGGRLTQVGAGMKGEATGINNPGDIVGYFWPKKGDQQGWLFSHGKLRFLSRPGTSWVEPADIDDHGNILATWGPGGASEDAFLGFIRGGKRQSFHKAKQFWCGLTQCNSHGDAIGEIDGVEAVYGFMWLKGKATTEPFYLLTSGINESGTVVGAQSRYREDPPREEVATIWRDGKMSRLQDLLPTSTTWTLERALAINDKDEIVGYGRNAGKRAVFLLRLSGQTSRAASTP